jgi:hypothetical protein
MPPKVVKPKQVRRRKYVCCYCDEVFYALPHTVHDSEPMCDECELGIHEEEEEDELLRIIKQKIASCNQQQKQTE